MGCTQKQNNLINIAGLTVFKIYERIFVNKSRQIELKNRRRWPTCSNSWVWSPIMGLQSASVTRWVVFVGPLPIKTIGRTAIGRLNVCGIGIGSSYSNSSKVTRPVLISDIFLLCSFKRCLFTLLADFLQIQLNEMIVEPLEIQTIAPNCRIEMPFPNVQSDHNGLWNFQFVLNFMDFSTLINYYIHLVELFFVTFKQTNEKKRTLSRLDWLQCKHFEISWCSVMHVCKCRCSFAFIINLSNSILLCICRRNRKLIGSQPMRKIFFIFEWSFFIHKK